MPIAVVFRNYSSGRQERIPLKKKFQTKFECSPSKLWLLMNVKKSEEVCMIQSTFLFLPRPKQ